MTVLVVVIAIIITAFFFFQKMGVEASWFDPGWAFRKRLTFNNSAQSTNLTNFPVMVKLTASNFSFPQAQSDGRDVRFTDSDGTTTLNYEIEKWDAAAKEAVLWVNVPQIDATSSTDHIYMYWGNPNAVDAPSADNTWGSSYKGVWHLGDNAASTTVADSSGNANNLTSQTNTDSEGVSQPGNTGNSYFMSGSPVVIPSPNGAVISEVHADVALDANGFPVIAYRDNTNSDLVIVHCNDKDCKGDNESVTAVVTTGDTGSQPSIVLDENGYPVVSYFDTTSTNLYLLHCNDVDCVGGDESNVVVDNSANEVGWHSVVVMDNNTPKRPVIAYHDNTAQDLKLAHCGNANCTSGNTINTVDGASIDAGSGFRNIDMVLDASYFPVISYYNTTNTAMRVAHCNDANCDPGGAESITTPIATASHGQSTAIELDGSGNPMIAYYDTTNTNLEFTKCNDPNCDGVGEATVTLTVNASTNQVDMAKDASGNPIIVANMSGVYPYVWHCGDTSCTSRPGSYITLYEQYNGYYPSVAANSNGDIAVVSYSYGLTSTYDAHLYTLRKKLERAYDTDFDFGTGSFTTSMWFKSDGQSRNDYLLSRYNADQGYAIHTNYAGQMCLSIDDDSSFGPDDRACSSNNLVTSNVDNGNVATLEAISFQFKSNGYPTILYDDAGNDDFELIDCTNATCTTSNFKSIDSTGDVGDSFSFVLDGNNYPVIAYYDVTNTALKYIRCTTTNCNTDTPVTVDDTAVQGANPTIKLDSEGNAVIVYYDSTNTAVRIIHCNDASCTGAANTSTIGADETARILTNLGTDQVTFMSDSLELDASNYPMVAYYDATGIDMEFIHCNDVNCNGADETLKTIDSGGSVGNYYSMTKNASGNPVLAYYYGSSIYLKLAVCNDTNCSSPTINKVTNTNDPIDGLYQIQLNLNGSGYPVISHSSYASFSQMLTVCDDQYCAGSNETVSYLRGTTSYNYLYGEARLNASGYPVFAYSDSSDMKLYTGDNVTTITENGSYDDGQWHLLTAVKNGTSSLNIYVDGVEVGNDVSITASGSLTSTNSAPLSIGQYHLASVGGLNNFPGYIDEVQIDNTARSADWVKAQYLSESNTFINVGSDSPNIEVRGKPNLWLALDEGQGVFANDSVWKKTGSTTNYATNPSFETSATTGWSIYNGPTTAQSTDAVIGSYSHSMTTGASSNPYIYKTDAPVSLSTGQQWSFSAYVKAGSAASVGNNVAINLRENGDNGYLSTTNATLTADWQRISVSRTLTHATPTSVNRWVRHDSTTGEVILIDGMQLELQATSTTYCDGSVTGSGSHVWNGTAHASTSTCDTGTDGMINGGTWQTSDMCVSGKCLKFDGSNDSVTVSGAVTDVKSVSFWVKPNTTTEYFVDLNGSAYIQASGGTISATGFTTPTIYVDGIPKSTLVANKWQHVEVTTATPLLASSIKVGKISTNYLQGFMDDVKFYSYTRSAAQVKQDYNAKGVGGVQGASASFGGGNISETLSEGLVGYWKMEETASPSLDSSGNNLSGTWANSPTSTTGKYGNAISMTSTANVSLGSQSIADNAANITVGAWVYPTAQTAATHYRIFTEQTVLYVGQYGSQVSFYMGDGASWLTSDTTGGALTINSWNHVVWVKNGTTASVYINGSLSKSGISAPATLGTSSNVNYISTYDGTNQPWAGRLDEIRLYNRALSEVEVRALYSYSAGPVAYWNMNENTGSTVYDISGNSNTGTLISGQTWTPGKFGSTADFDGANDVITIPSSTTLSQTKGFTVGGWVKMDEAFPSSASDSLGIVDKVDYQFYLDKSDGKAKWVVNDTTAAALSHLNYGFDVDVFSLAVYNGELIAGGYFTGPGVGGTCANCNHIAKWNGSAWSSLSFGLNGEVLAMTVYNGELIAAGGFNGPGAGGTCANCNKIAKWNGSAWSSVGFGFGNEVDALTVYNGELVAGGTFTGPGAGGTCADCNYIAKWDGSSWSTIGNGFNSNVYSLTVYDGELIAGGIMTGPGSGGTCTDCNYIAKWDGESWSGVAYGFTGGSVNALVVYNGDLIAGGGFTGPGAGGTCANCNKIAKWNGSAWSTMANGFGSTVYALTTINGELVAAGSFTGPGAGGTCANCNFIAKWNGSAWSSIDYGFDSQLQALTTYKNDLYAGGLFTGPGVGGTCANCNMIAKWGTSNVKEVASTTASWTANTWYHLTGQFDPVQGKLLIYVNGTLNNSIATSITTLPQQGKSLRIGSTYGTQMTGNGGQFFKGAIDDVYVYDYVRTSGQIVEDMNGGHPAPGSPVGSAVAYWKFDEGYGTTSNDSSQSNRTVTLAGTSLPTWSNDGRMGKSLQYDGTASYTTITQDPVSGLQQMTLSTWVKVDPSDTTGPIVGNVFGYYYRYGIHVSSGVYRALFRSTGGTGVLSSGISYTGNWDHVLITYDNSAMKIFVNGVLANTGTFAYAPLTQSTNTINFGTHSTASGDWFKGNIDEVKIYNFAFSDDQVKVEYNQGKAQVLGSLSTASDGKTGDWSSAREYCVPGDTTACSAPIAEWKLDENTGTSAKDTSGNASTGTLTGGPTWIAGKFGSAVNFDGNNDYVLVSDNAVLSPGTGDYSISARIKTSTNFATTASVVSNYGSDSMSAAALSITSAELPSCTLRDQSGFGASATGTSVINDSKWHSISCVLSGANLYIYVDGVRVNTSDASSIGNIDTTGLAKTIGTYAVTPTTQNFTGYIDDVRIYGYARTPAQIAWEYNQGAPVAWYKFDECQGTTIYNSAKNGNGDAAGNNGTLTLTPAGVTTAGTCSTSGAWNNGASGKINASMDFDGTDDRVVVTDPASGILDFGTNEMSVALWIKTSQTPASVQPIIDKKAGGSNDAGYNLNVNTDGRATFRVANGTSQASASSSTSNLINDGVWHHVVGTYARSAGGDTLYVFVDGLLAGSTGVTAGWDINSTHNLDIGRLNGSATYLLDGQLDDIRIFNYAMTGAQVRDVYNNGAVSFK